MTSVPKTFVSSASASVIVGERTGRAGDHGDVQPEFVAVNCGSLPRTLIESELFGYKRGAFSGADSDRLGLVRNAHRGTLFLDEVAELPEQSQASLLRVLQEREVCPVGDARPVRVDIRIVAATNQDLEQRVNSGRFRTDLYARLAGFTTQLLPLRDRREDLGALIAKLLPRVAGDHAGEVRFSRRAAHLLLGYQWPLNVREL